MALFKISKGSKANLPTTLTEGFCWYTYDDSKFYIDHKDETGALVRKALNAQDAETLTGASLSTILNSSELEIPTSKAVLDALDVAKTELSEQIEELNSAIDDRMPVPSGYDSTDYCVAGFAYGEPSALPLNPDGADGYSVPMRDWDGDIMLPYDQDALFTWDESYEQYGKGDYGDHYAISAATARKYFYTKEDLAYLDEAFARDNTGITISLTNLDSVGYLGFGLSDPLEEDTTVYVQYSYPLLGGNGDREGTRELTIPAGETSWEVRLFDDISQIELDGGGYSTFYNFWSEDPDSSPIKYIDDERLLVVTGSTVELNVDSISAAEVYATNMYVDGVEVATKNDLVGVGGDYVPLPENIADQERGILYAVIYRNEEPYIMPLLEDSAESSHIPIRDADGDIALSDQQDGSYISDKFDFAVSGRAVYDYVNNTVVGNLEDAIAQISAELHTYAQNLTGGES